MAPPPKPSSKRRLPLSRDRVLLAGVSFADKYGIGLLSMRKLGEAVGCRGHVAVQPRGQ